MTAQVVQFQKKQEAKFICSACGADRACDCNAPALEREAARHEIDRQRSARYRTKKREQKQQTRHVTDNVMPTLEEADESYQETLFDQASLLIDLMADETRKRFFAYVEDKYHAIIKD